MLTSGLSVFALWGVDQVIVSRTMHDELALRTLREFTGESPRDRRHLCLAALSKLIGVQQILGSANRLELSPTTRSELDHLLTEILTCVDIVLSNQN